MDDNNNGVWNPLEENNEPAFPPATIEENKPIEVTFETQKNESSQEYYVSGHTGSDDYRQAFDAGRIMDMQEFAKLPELKSITRNITAAAILCYISAAITGIAIFALGNFNGISFSPLNFIDVGILLACGLFLQLRRSFPAAIVILVYGAINVISVLVMTGKLGGWLVLLAGIFAVIYCYKLKKAYKEYLATGRVNPNA